MIGEICFQDVILKSTQSVFETMIFMDIAESCDPALKESHPDTILGSITFKGTIEGCLSISCGQACGQEIAMNMLGMEPDEEISEEEINDAIGEVCNMVMGNLKTYLDDGDTQIEISIPSVVNGNGLKRCLRGSSSSALFEACLEDMYPLSVLLEYRMAAGQKAN